MYLFRPLDILMRFRPNLLISDSLIIGHSGLLALKLLRVKIKFYSIRWGEGKGSEVAERTYVLPNPEEQI